MCFLIFFFSFVVFFALIWFSSFLFGFVAVIVVRSLSANNIYKSTHMDGSKSETDRMNNPSNK